MDLLSSMNTDAVCECVKQIDGIDTSMLPQYSSTIKKVRLLIIDTPDVFVSGVCSDCLQASPRCPQLRPCQQIQSTNESVSSSSVAG